MFEDHQRAGRGLPARASRTANAECVFIFGLALALVVLLQLAAHAYQSGYGAHPDEAAHLVTALLVRDFIANGDYLHPWHYAVDYYLHYPKVALGHWPPLFYGLSGAWFVLAGASRLTALLVIATAAAMTGSAIYCTGKRLIGRLAGALAALLFLASPLVQESSDRFMQEHVVTFGMLISMLLFARFARRETWVDGLLFGLAAALAILTRGSGWALALVPGLTILLTGRWHLLARPGLWLAALPVLATCVPWYWATKGMVEGSWVGAGDEAFWRLALPAFGAFVYSGLGSAVCLLAAVGVWARLIRPAAGRPFAPEWAALFALAAATLALQCVIPASIEPRFMVTLVPSIVLFAVAGMAYVAREPPAFVALGLAVVVAFLAQTFTVPAQLRNTGYAAIAADFSGKPHVWLVASGSRGEGSLIAAIALHETRPGSVILRGSKTLVREDWLGRASEDRFATPEAVRAMLDSVPVTVVAIDNSVPESERRPYHSRLAALVAADVKEWRLAASYPLRRGAVLLPDAVQVYVREPPSDAGDLTSPTLDRVAALLGSERMR